MKRSVQKTKKIIPRMGHFIESKTFSLYLIRKGKIISPLIAVLFDKNLFVFNVTTCKLIFSIFFKQNDS